MRGHACRWRGWLERIVIGLLVYVPGLAQVRGNRLVECLSQRYSHSSGGGDACFWVFGDALQHNRREGRRDICVDEVWWSRLLLHMLHHDRDRGIAAKRCNAGHHLVQDDADLIEIGTLINYPAPRLLW